MDDQRQCAKEIAEFVESARLKAQSFEDMVELFELLLTSSELRAISHRLIILDMLSSGIPQRQISDKLKVGIATVTRGSRMWRENQKSLSRHFPFPEKTRTPG